MTKVHRMYFHFSEFPPSLRVLFSGALMVLGIAYVFAMIQTYVSHASRDGDPMLSVNDLIIAYSGNRKASRLESAIGGPMKDMVDEHGAAHFVLWAHQGGSIEEYEQEIKPIVEANCLGCHDGSNPHLPDLRTYEALHELIAVDTGTNVITLVRISHIHLFGITFIFFIVGYIFSHALVRPVWIKCAVIAVPFVSIVLDIFSWYLTKLNPAFAWVIYIGGIFMALSFAFMWVTSMYQMWLMKPPQDLIRE